MGCCFDRPTASIVDDPTVVASATVGDIYFDYGCYQSYNIGGCARGLMYVKDEKLWYESTCCGNRHLCCKFCQCCSCCGESFELAELSCVEAIENLSFGVRGQQGTYISLNPGLRITTRQNSNNEVLVLVQMQDAHNFVANLKCISN